GLPGFWLAEGLGPGRVDSTTGKRYVFLTNNRHWDAQTVADIYKERWAIEVFFKQIKSHRKIKSFVGTSENAVLIQIWTAMIAMLLLKYLKEKAQYDWHLSNLVTFIRLNLVVKIDRAGDPVDEMAEQPVLQANNWNPGRPTTYKVWIDFRNKLKNRVEILEATFSQLQKTFWTAVLPHNGFGLCGRAGFGAQNCLPALNLNRSTKFQVCTSARLTQNPCYSQLFFRPYVYCDCCPPPSSLIFASICLL